MDMSVILLWLVALPVFLLLLGGLIVLQVWLCRRPSRLLGLILPGITLVISILAVLGLCSFLSISSGGTPAYADGFFALVFSMTPMALIVFFLMNLPTAVLLIIYFACRRPFRKQKELNRMQIEDLR